MVSKRCRSSGARSGRSSVQRVACLLHRALILAGGGLGKLGLGLQAEHFLGLVRQQRGQVAGAGAQFQHAHHLALRIQPQTRVQCGQAARSRGSVASAACEPATGSPGRP